MVKTNSRPSFDTDEAIETRKRQQRADALWDQCGVPERHKLLSHDEAVKHDKFMEAYWKGLGIVKAGETVLILGDRGNGKTQCGVAFIQTCCDGLKCSQYIRCRGIGMKLREAFKPNAVISETQAVENFVRPWLLVIDECQERMESDFEYRSLNMILDMRYGALKPTVLIANCNAKQFAELLGSSIIDRVKEGGGMLLFDWPSFRGKQAEG